MSGRPYCNCGCSDYAAAVAQEAPKATPPERGSELAAQIRQAVREEQGPAFQDGDVLRWLWTPTEPRYFGEGAEEVKTYTYAAVRAGGRWYVTGPTQVRQDGRTWKALQETLAGPGITDLTLATGWSAV